MKNIIVYVVVGLQLVSIISSINLYKLLYQVELEDLLEKIQEREARLKIGHHSPVQTAISTSENPEVKQETKSEKNEPKQEEMALKSQPVETENKREHTAEHETKLKDSEQPHAISYRATFYSREETNNNLPSSGVRGSTLDEALRGYGLLQVSVDPNEIPLFTRMTIVLWNNTVVNAMALDTGTPRSIDIYVNTIQEAIELGVKKVGVEIAK